jgi:hypothetical protein
MPYMRKASAIKEKFLKEEVDKTLNKLVGNSPAAKAIDMDVNCALEDILRREMLLSEKEGRPPIFHSRDIYDEVVPLMASKFMIIDLPTFTDPRLYYRCLRYYCNNNYMDS